MSNPNEQPQPVYEQPWRYLFRGDDSPWFPSAATAMRPFVVDLDGTPPIDFDDPEEMTDPNAEKQ